MALNSEKLIEKMDEKATLILGQSYIANSSEMKEKLFKVIAESVIEHIQEYAEVKVLIVGSDAGIGLRTSDLFDKFESDDRETRVKLRGDVLVPDLLINSAITSVVTTGNIPASFALLNSGFVK